MKKVFSCIMTAAVTVSLCGCGSVIEDTFGKFSKGLETIRDSVNTGADVIENLENEITDELAEKTDKPVVESTDEPINKTDVSANDENKDSTEDFEPYIAEKAEDGPVDSLAYVKAYSDIVNVQADVRKKNEEVQKDTKYPFDSYYIYDIDKDGIPELILQYGELGEDVFTEDYKGVVYTMDGNSAVILDDDFELSYADLYTDPGENGMLCYRYSAKKATCYRVTYENGERMEEELHTEEAEGTDNYLKRGRYKSPSKIVPGSYELCHTRNFVTLPIRKYDSIMKHIDGNRGDLIELSFPDNDENYYENIISENKEIYLYGADKYMHNKGLIHYEDIFNKDVLRDNTGNKIKFVEKKYADLNEDGVYECIIYLRGEYASGNSDMRVIMTVEDGENYAYSSFYPPETDITEYGEFENHSRYGSSYYRIIFDKEEAEEYYVPVWENQAS